jgi:hypothetical protein
VDADVPHRDDSTFYSNHSVFGHGVIHAVDRCYNHAEKYRMPSAVLLNLITPGNIPRSLLRIDLYEILSM